MHPTQKARQAREARLLDAFRYRWLRLYNGNRYAGLTGEDLDREIDRDIQGSESQDSADRDRG